MSTHHIPYPPDFEINYHQDRQVQRVERAFRALDPGEVLAVLDDQLAQEPDPTTHPLYPMVLFLLDRQTAVDGATLYDDCRRLVLAAINACLEARLALED